MSEPTAPRREDGLHARLTALQIRLDTSHSQTSRLLSVVGDLSTQVSAAMADASSDAAGVGGRMQHLARDAETMLGRLVSSADSIGESIADVAQRVDRLGGTAGDIGRRLNRDVEQYESTILASIERLEVATSSLTTGLVSDVGDLVDVLREAVFDVQNDLSGTTDANLVRIQRMVDRLDERIERHAGMLGSTTGALEATVDSLMAAQDDARTATESLSDTATNFHQMSVIALDRIVGAGAALEGRISEIVDAAIHAGSAQSAADIEAMTTTVSWASRQVQQVVETLTDDLTSSTKASLERLERAGSDGQDSIRQAVAHAEQAIVAEVARSVEPLHTETRRVAEQQSLLAETIHSAETALSRREAEVEQRESALARIESALTAAADLLSERTRMLREEQLTAVDEAAGVADRLVQGAHETGRVLGQLREVSEQLEVATMAADSSRQALLGLVTRAEELAADAAAGRRRVDPVPPPA